MTDQSPVAVITGAGSGIGRAASILLGRGGWRLALLGRTISKLEETASLIRREAPGAEVITIGMDAADESACRRAIDEVVRRRARLDALVNNAAVLHVGAIDEVDSAMLRPTFAANVFGPFHLVAAAWKTFVSQKRGVVVNVSSIATADPFPGLAAYAASKGALESLTRSILVEGGAAGLRAFSVAPGAVETPMLRSAYSTDVLPPEGVLDPFLVAQVIVDCILGRRGDPDGAPIYLPSHG